MAADDTPEPPVLTPWENHGGYEFISGSAMLVRLAPLWGIRLLLRYKWWTIVNVYDSLQRSCFLTPH